MKRCIAVLGLTCVWLTLETLPALAQQHKVSPRMTHERCWAIVSMVGAGTAEDPRRPMYAPIPGRAKLTSATDILGFSAVVSDDGRFALVEFVAADRSAFKDMRADVSVKSFLKGIAGPQGAQSTADIEAEFKKLKKDFDFNTFGVRMQ